MTTSQQGSGRSEHESVVSRLRSALDELTTGPAPTVAPVAMRTSRPSRWLLPAAAVAAVAALGATVAIASQRDGTTTPAAPVPSGPPIAPVPQTIPAPAVMPWFELRLDDGTAALPLADIDAGPLPGAGLGAQVWASDDYSRVLIAKAAITPNAQEDPGEGPGVEALPDPAFGKAWALSGNVSGQEWHNIYWAPDAQTSVVLSGYGFTPSELAAVLPALKVERSEAGPRVASTLSSLTEVSGGVADGLYTSDYSLPGSDEAHPTWLAVSASGSLRPLALYAATATSIVPTATPFGDGFRLTHEDQVFVWWRVDGGPFWAALSAPADRIDDLLARVVRVDDVVVPQSQQVAALPNVSPAVDAQSGVNATVSGS